MNAETLELTFHEKLHYTTKEPVSIKEIVESLLGLEQLIKQSPAVFAGITECKIDNVEILIENIQSGSLLEDIAVKILFKDKESMDKFLERIHAKIGDGPMRNTIVGLIIFALLSQGLFYASQLMDSKSAPNFEANNNVIINIGANAVDMDAEKFRAVFESAIADKKALAKNAVRVLAPSRNDPESTFIIETANEQPKLELPAELIVQAPTSVNQDPAEQVKEYKDVDVQIRALDLDNPKKGWAAVIPGIVERRVKLVLTDGIDPNALAGRFSFRADVRVINRMTQKDTEFKPCEIVLLQLIEATE